MTERVAGGVRQGFWFGCESVFDVGSSATRSGGGTTVCFGINIGWDASLEADANDTVGPDSQTAKLFRVLQDIFGTIVRYDYDNGHRLVFIVENCKYEVAADGEFSVANRDAIENVLNGTVTLPHCDLL